MSITRNNNVYVHATDRVTAKATAVAMAMIAVTATAIAQGYGNSHGHGNGNACGHGNGQCSVCWVNLLILTSVLVYTIPSIGWPEI